MRYNYRQDLFDAIRKLGYKPHFTRETPTTIDKFIDESLRDLYKHYSLRKIEKLLPISYHAIREHLIALNVQFRPKGGPNNYKHGKFVGLRKK